MKARRINLEPYQYHTGRVMSLPQADGTLKQEPEITDYDVRETLVNILLHPARKLNGSAFLKAETLSRKVMEAESFQLDLSEGDFAEIRQVVDAFQGYGRHDAEFLHRVMDAPEIELT